MRCPDEAPPTGSVAETWRWLPATVDFQDPRPGFLPHSRRFAEDLLRNGSDNRCNRVSSMRILHTSDWHLGHVLRHQPRDHEHAFFLNWLLEVIGREQVDALLIAGDVFETANPPATAWKRWFAFLAELRNRYPRLDVVAIAGNHDSAARLEAPERILRDLGVFVVGAVSRKEDGSLDEDRLLIPLHDAAGQQAALCMAIPFLRQADLPAISVRESPGAKPEELDPLIEGVRALHAEIHSAAKRRCKPGQALVAMGHCYMVGTRVSELSERKVLGGNQHALPVDLFPEDIAYVALGHMHLAQTVGQRENVRYCGSPIPLSMAERGYQHQVCLVDLNGETEVRITSLPLPRLVEMLRIPDRGTGTPDEILAELERLPPRESGTEKQLRPYLEVAAVVDRPMPELPRLIEKVLEDREPRLIRLTLKMTGDHQGLADSSGAVELQDLRPDQVFRRRYARDHDGPPPPELLAAFHGLVDEVAQEEA